MELKNLDYNDAGKVAKAIIRYKNNVYGLRNILNRVNIYIYNQLNNIPEVKKILEERQNRMAKQNKEELKTKIDILLTLSDNDLVTEITSVGKKGHYKNFIIHLRRQRDENSKQLSEKIIRLKEKIVNKLDKQTDQELIGALEFITNRKGPPN